MSLVRLLVGGSLGDPNVELLICYYFVICCVELLHAESRLGDGK